MSDMAIMVADLVADLISKDYKLCLKYTLIGADPSDLFWFFNESPENLSAGLKDLRDTEAIQDYISAHHWSDAEADFFWYEYQLKVA